MDDIKVYKIMKPNTIIGISKEIKIRDLPFTINGHTIEILEYVNSWDNIRIKCPCSYKNIIIKCQISNN